MGENSAIEWTDHTFSPWIGCTNVSAACDNCYAETWNNRFNPGDWGPHADRRRTKTWGQPVKWNRALEGTGRRQRVFCASLADVFDNHKSILPEWRSDLWALIRKTPNLDWLLLTKRPQNIKRYLPDDWGAGYSNVWLGTTVEDQKTAEQRIPHLQMVPAKVRFLSCEPLLGRLDLEYPETFFPGGPDRCCSGRDCGCLGLPTETPMIYGINWIITGGESGPNCRPTDPDWFRGLRDQCAQWDVAFLFKQYGGKTRSQIKAQGRELDGVVHDGYPTP